VVHAVAKLTVKDLIEILLMCNQDAEVFFENSEPIQEVSSHSHNKIFQVFIG